MSKLTSTIQGNYPLNTFGTICDRLRQMVQVIGQDGRLVTNDSFLVACDRSINTLQSNLPKFLLLQSPQFHALIVGNIVNVDNHQQIAIESTFSPVEIDRFIEPLLPYLPSTVSLIANANFVNDRELQSHCDRLLSDALAGSMLPVNPMLLHSDVDLSTREIQLQQQLERAHLLNYISTQIYQILDLSVILQTAVEQVQTFLHADRLIIYQLEFAKVDGKVGTKSFETYNAMGKVAYEAIGGANLPSVLDVDDYQDCFDDRQLWDKYRGGMMRSIDNVELEYAENQCMLDLMRRFQIKSKSIVPIVVNRELWGLIIAHQCHTPRQWQTDEIKFLQQVAEHLALAIDRAEFYADSLWHTQNLEQSVNERTRELRDALIVAQAANQSKTEFLALLSHELRTPLTSILGLSATLLRLPQVNLTDRQQSYLQTIYNSGEHLSELIDEILDYYKLEVGKTFLKISEFSLSKLIQRVVEIVSEKANQHKIELEVQIINDGEDVTNVSGRDLRFRGDTKRIRQILLNILVNAIKFTPENGKVIIRSWLEDCYAVFEIEDNGIGIDAEQIPRLFKKFHQLNSNYDRDREGMGLGLAITQQLVELHGGWIDVESVVGSGSTFTVRVASQQLKLPERNDLQEMDRKLVFQDPELNPIPNAIILIEQDEDLANFMCDILTTARYQVTWLLSAESSFRQIAMFEPDLLIIDLTIGSSADRTIENIRKSNALGHVKILAIATPEDLISPISKQYVDDYLSKPVNPEQLLRKIAKLLSPIES